jgi:hypothetical protein
VQRCALLGYSEVRLVNLTVRSGLRRTVFLSYLVRQRVVLGLRFYEYFSYLLRVLGEVTV